MAGCGRGMPSLAPTHSPQIKQERQVICYRVPSRGREKVRGHHIAGMTFDPA